MTKLFLTFALAFFSISITVKSQVAINTDGSSPNSSAMLDISSSDKGLLIPRLTTAQRNTLATSAVAGLIVYDTDLSKFFFHNGVTWESGSVGNLFSQNGSNIYPTVLTNYLGIGTTSPARALEVKGGWQTARLSTSTDGAFLEFDGTNTTDWAIGTWGGSVRLLSTTNNFSSTLDEYYFTTTGFFPVSDNGNTLGTSNKRWSTLYSMNGYFSGKVGIGPNAPSAELEVSTASGETEVRITRPSSSFAATLSFYTGSSGEWNFTTASGNDNMVIYRGTGNTTGNLHLMHSGGSVGIGTLSPTRTLEVKGPWQTARISSTGAGAMLEFVSDTHDDWAVATWNGNMYFLSSTNNFSSKTDEYTLSTTSFNPFTNNTKTLGSSTKRWSKLYSGVGDFSSAGSGITGATVHSENTLTTGGIAGSFKTNGSDATIVLGQDGTGPFLKAFGPNGGNEEIFIGNDGVVSLFNSSHVKTIMIAPVEGAGTTAGQITMYNAAGAVTIEIDGDYGDGGDGRITTNEIQITGGSDLSEFFDLSDYGNIEKGMVVSIDENNPGHLILSSEAYDRKVAGIISGANEIEPGLIMSQKGSIADGEHLVALSGRVYCMVDATEKPVAIGDMLTTSSVTGHAMKVEDFNLARGAIIGKAMTSLDSGKGLVLVLVSLQ